MSRIPKTLYKLTDQDGYTRRGYYNQCLWGPGVSHSGTGVGDLCGPGFIHAYTSPELAAFLNPLHAGFQRPRFWVASGEVAKSDNGLKVGCVTLTTVGEIPAINPTLEQRVTFAILCAKSVCRDKTWVPWADGWLSGKDRSAQAAQAAGAVAGWAAGAAGAAMAARAAEAAGAAGAAMAARAAEAAARAAQAAGAVAAEAAGAAGAAMAAQAAEAAARASDIDLDRLAKQAMQTLAE